MRQTLPVSGTSGTGVCAAKAECAMRSAEELKEMGSEWVLWMRLKSAVEERAVQGVGPEAGWKVEWPVGVCVVTRRVKGGRGESWEGWRERREEGSEEVIAGRGRWGIVRGKK